MDSEKKKNASYRKPKSGAFPAGKEQVVEFQSTGGLVGRIVEKGFSSISSSTSNPAKSSLISYPQPTVLPFPVARHRSHGPHWNPLHGAPEPEDEELVEDMDQTDYAPLSTSASPIERKQKKCMDFSRWRDFNPSGDSAASHIESKGSRPAEEKKKILSTIATPDSVKEFTELQQGKLDSALYVKKARFDSFLGRHGGAAVRELSIGYEATEPVVSVGREFDTVPEEKLMTRYDGQVFESTMDDIHMENLARLRQMSAEEITEAQTEIIEKMKPAIIDMLKRRGSKKLRSKDTTVQDQKEAGHHVVPGCLFNINNSESDHVLNRLPAKDVKASETSASLGNGMPEGQRNSNFWKIWSERVEKVRDFRFSLEGNIVEVDWGQVSNGHNPEVGHPSVDNVAERDFLRTEGEPAALGYSIKEAVALMRSMVPAQRALALKLLNIILNKALFNLMNKKVGHEGKGDTNSNGVDWQAIWAYVLGPEPQLVLSLRIALDDNHDSVVLACAKVIQCILSCDLNENFFSVAEKVPTIQKVLCTAPVFRSRPEVDDGFLHGGFWKYNTKPSNILPSNVDSRNNEHEENHTIQDDLVVAGQDIAAGLVRMGLIPRICYLLEMEPVPALVECLVSVLIGLARHSLVCANAIIQCSSLIQSLVSILTRQGMMEIRCQIKAITLLKVLCQMDKLFCSNFVKGGIFQQVMWHWYRSPLSMDEWVQYGKEYCKLMASLMIEQLRLWKVCIGYGYCLTSFSDFFPHMCLWLSRPKFDKLLQFDVLDEFAWITREAYHTLATLAEWLPSLHSVYQQKMTNINLVQDGMETWSWGNVVPMVDLAISWLSVKDIPYICLFTHFKESALSNSSSLSSMIWVVSAVMHMLSSIFHRISPKNAHYGDNPTVLPWLPQFAPKVGIELVKNEILSFSGLGDSIPKASSLSEALCYLRHLGNLDVSLSSTSCLLGLVRLGSLVDKCIQGARNGCDFMTSGGSEIQERILAEG
ncbi:hypothetical protein HPP92_024001 [Vanilla planifolia]|uniref:Uncharacterized protein n=1 Tax=Vanilla planifolia TaxID=51239 RepID=A0A835PN36_VANPL|nr:hypothetical protein HPP92_024001 [Vanilla planifolia]